MKEVFDVSPRSYPGSKRRFFVTSCVDVLLVVGGILDDYE